MKINKNLVDIQFRNLIDRRRIKGNLRPNLKKKEMLNRRFRGHLQMRVRARLKQCHEIVFRVCPLQRQGVEIALSSY